ncbi:hypothetical protein GCM10025781_24670 [Kocuria gwangalliensis]|uniref:Uncharacterized protein n=1 Tax=Kocuria gwangalliensis TaxID=501592 RepID=A0ABP8XBE0_9MICC
MSHWLDVVILSAQADRVLDGRGKLSGPGSGRAGARDKLNQQYRTGTPTAGQDHQGSSEGHTNVHEYG